MVTSSELRSVDLNVLGEWYIPSSDIFSEPKDDGNLDSTEEAESKEETKELEINVRNRHYVLRK